jgi:hypothetical protein
MLLEVDAPFLGDQGRIGSDAIGDTKRSRFTNLVEISGVQEELHDYTPVKLSIVDCRLPI